ncbi:MAG TPA: signal recognition particle protein [Candidatus Marinimicrobia bacterium]|nr:signal recognition particle protein [Candidatus Neomarinimicrobiota bacterium]HRD17880.1 signal recognition particle protein [Candidatus Neomarinimicrobiota bacterium]
MFEQLQNGFGAIIKSLRGEGRITENNIADAMRQIRRVLLEADVNYKVAKEFVQSVQEKSVGVTVAKSLSPGQLIVKIIYDEMVHLLGDKNRNLKEASIPPTIIMLVGLQGSGKTTCAAKLAYQLLQKQHSPVLVPVDVYRPAAEEQLEILARQIKVPCFCENPDVVGRIQDAITFARQQHRDTLIIDTAGRLHIDEKMMAELKTIKNTIKPHNILLVVDGMTGQDAVNTATSFNEQIGVDGIILTKMDSDTRGGAALTIVSSTGKPIIYMSVGEKISDLEIFHPERVAGRILGMGDVVSLVEKVQASVDLESALKLENKLKKEQFTLEDYLTQLRQLKKLGPLDSVMEHLPGFARMRLGNQKVDEKELIKAEAIIQSMTRTERLKPNIINGSRRRRIALGSGTQPQDVNRLLNQYWQITKLMKQMGRMKLPKNLSAFGIGN